MAAFSFLVLSLSLSLFTPSINLKLVALIPFPWHAPRVSPLMARLLTYSNLCEGKSVLI